jgi:hypothetical protein
MKRAARKPPSCSWLQSGYAALSHIDVSKALLINGMFMPKLAFAACLPAVFAACLTVTFWATSVARSHDPFSWERATEKNKNT